MTETLLDAVDALTTRWSIDVRDDQGKLVKRVRHKPRLRMLEDAVAKSTSAGGGASLVSERYNGDEHAIEMLKSYTATINRMARDLDVPKRGSYYNDPLATLRAWYVTALKRTITDTWAIPHIDTLTRWAREIDKKLNPPDEAITIERPCPRCESVVWFDKAMGGAEMRWPLTSERFSSGQHGIDHARVHCRFCGHTWDGISQVRALAYDMEVMDATHDEMQTGTA